ncbi:MAG TPA: DUF6438 domain-containing protein [Bacteroidia bacterium]|jgi:hypothetical protein|nr:DUF6438 domain-containing protein [Bacteroidia bacterium]
MKKIFTPLFLFLFSIPLFANDIDMLKTDRDVEKFIRAEFPALSDARVAYKDFLYPDFIKQRIADSLHVKLWQKTDFDNNGKSDLLVFISTGGQNYLTAIMDEGVSYGVHFISKWPFADIYFPVVKKTDNSTLLLLYKTCAFCHGTNENSIKTDTLIYKFGSFIERTVNPPSYKIEKVEFSTGACEGTCPVYSITIQPSHKAYYNAINYNDTTGQFSGIVDTLHYNKLVRMLNYLDFPKLKDNYTVLWKDAPQSTLLITYEGGKSKKIQDYGEAGTQGLSVIYGILSDLRKNQVWK